MTADCQVARADTRLRRGRPGLGEPASMGGSGGRAPARACRSWPTDRSGFVAWWLWEILDLSL